MNDDFDQVENPAPAPAQERRPAVLAKPAGVVDRKAEAAKSAEQERERRERVRATPWITCGVESCPNLLTSNQFLDAGRICRACRRQHRGDAAFWEQPQRDGQFYCAGGCGAAVAQAGKCGRCFTGRQSIFVRV